MMNTYRVYGKTLERWTSEKEKGWEVTVQEELAYTEYYEDGTIYCTGSADFTPESKRRFLEEAWVWYWDGKSYNRGGYRKFEQIGHRVYDKSGKKLYAAALKKKYHAEIIQFRK